MSWVHLHPLWNACAHPHVQAHVSPRQEGKGWSLWSLWSLCLPQDGQSSASISEHASRPGRSRQTRERSPVSARRCHPPTPLEKHLQEKCLSAKPAALLKAAMNTAQAAGGGRRRLWGSRWSYTPASPAPAHSSLIRPGRALPISDPADIRELSAWNRNPKSRLQQDSDSHGAEQADKSWA